MWVLRATQVLREMPESWDSQVVRETLVLWAFRVLQVSRVQQVSREVWDIQAALVYKDTLAPGVSQEVKAHRDY